MTHDHDHILTELQDRVTDLEFAQHKAEWDQKKQTAVPGKRSASVKDDPWKVLHVTTLSKGQKRYQLEYASGRTMDLPEDRSAWPADVRTMQERVEAAHKQRRVNGRLTAMAGGTYEIR